MDHDGLCSARGRDSRGVVEHADRHPMLLAAGLEVTEERGDRRVHRESDAGALRERAQGRG